MAEIPVVGAVLKWARDFRGLSLQEAATRAGLSEEELNAFEEDTRKPSLTKFERIAAAYRLPAATLFRKTRPVVPKPPSDFRTFGGAPHEESFEFRVALSNVRTLQATLRALREEDEEFPMVDLRKYNFGQDPFRQGEEERSKIGVSISQQLQWKADEAFRRWRAVIERLGIAVYLQNFSKNDCRGWSMEEEETPPAIIINKQDDTAVGRTFTLIHEYVHLLIRRPGISDLNSENPTEAFCNRFAGAFLMPQAALEALLPEWPKEPIDWDAAVVRSIAARLKVSARALAIRLEELKKARKGFNRQFVTKPKEQKRPNGNGGPDPTKVRLNELGGRYTQAVISALDRAVIDSVHASQALGIGPLNFSKARAYIERYENLAAGGSRQA